MPALFLRPSSVGRERSSSLAFHLHPKTEVPPTDASIREGQATFNSPGAPCRWASSSGKPDVSLLWNNSTGYRVRVTRNHRGRLGFGDRMGRITQVIRHGGCGDSNRPYPSNGGRHDDGFGTIITNLATLQRALNSQNGSDS